MDLKKSTEIVTSIRKQQVCLSKLGCKSSWINVNQVLKTRHDYCIAPDSLKSVTVIKIAAHKI